MSFGVIMVIAKWSASLIVPLLISIMITLLLHPLMRWLEHKGVSRMLSLALVIAIMLIILSLFGIFVIAEINDFVSKLPEIKLEFQTIVEDFFSFLSKLGVPELEQPNVEAFLSPDGLVGFTKQLLMQLSNQFSHTVLIVLTSSFLIMDSVNFQDRLEYILEDNPEQYQALIKVSNKIYTYFIIMAKISLFIAIASLFLLFYFKIEDAILWAFLIFFFNFIPVVGFPVAVIPPVVLGLVEHSWGTALWLILGFSAIKSIIGNVLQPSMMGKGLGLSTFTIFWSIIYWGWFFGPVGMILSVPLTMVVQYFLMQYDETRWLGFLLGDYSKKRSGKLSEETLT